MTLQNQTAAALSVSTRSVSESANTPANDTSHLSETGTNAHLGVGPGSDDVRFAVTGPVADSEARMPPVSDAAANNGVQGAHQHAAALPEAPSETPPAPTRYASASADDSFTGTKGNETLVLNASPASYFANSPAHSHGTADRFDVLHFLGDHEVLDLTSLFGKTPAAKMSSFEVIDLGGHMNTLKLSLTDVLNLGEIDLFQSDGKQQLMVNGHDGDAVDLWNTELAGTVHGEWQMHETAHVGGVAYDVFEHSSAHTELLVQQGMQVALHN